MVGSFIKYQAALGVAAGLLALATLAGCAAGPERQAFAALAAAASAPPQPGPATDSSPPLPRLPADATLQDHLVYAALNNPQLEAAFEQWKAALHRVPQARTLPDPRFTYGHFIQEVETRVGPQEQRFGLSQMFPWFGKLRLRGDVALAEANSRQQQYESAKLKLFYQVQDAYYEYYYLGRAIAITEDNVRLLQHLESVARAKHRAGAPLSGVIKAQVELGKLDDQLRSLRDLEGPVVARLNAALNRPPEAPLPWPKQIPAMGEMTTSDADALRWLSENSPELRSLDDGARGTEWHAVPLHEAAGGDPPCCLGRGGQVLRFL